MKRTLIASLTILLLFCSCHNKKADLTQQSGITAEMAYEGVSNYCHSEFDWSVAESNPSIMSLEMGEETDSEYQVVFRSYTGSYVYFYVQKSTGTTRMVEYVPVLDIKSESGTIDLYDYLEKKDY